MIQVWAQDFVGTFRNPATVNSSNIYWALTYLFAGNSTVKQSLYPFGFSLRPWTKAYLKTSYHWTFQIKIIFCCCCLLSPFGVSVTPRLKGLVTPSPFRSDVSLFDFVLLSLHMLFDWLCLNLFQKRFKSSYNCATRTYSKLTWNCNLKVSMKWKTEMRQIHSIHPIKSGPQFSFPVSSSQYSKNYIILTQLKMCLS